MLEHMMQTNNVQNLIQKAPSHRHPAAQKCTAQATGIAAADVAGGNDQKPLLSASGHEQMEAAWVKPSKRWSQSGSLKIVMWLFHDFKKHHGELCHRSVVLEFEPSLIPTTFLTFRCQKTVFDLKMTLIL